jgi:hypothetical protein
MDTQKNCAAALLCLTHLAGGALFAQTPLSRIGYAIPGDADAAAAAIGTSGQCQAKGRVVLPPAVPFDPAAAAVASQGSNYLSAIPEEADAFLRIRVRIGTLDVSQHERIIGDRVTELLRGMPLSSPRVKGLLIEAEDPTAPAQVVQFTLAQIIVKAKGTRADLKTVLHFNPGFIGRNNDLVKRLAVYADGFGLNASARWRDDASWIAKDALNKPLYLRLDDTAPLKASWLEAALGSAGANVELLWVDTKAAASIGDLCGVAGFLGQFLKIDSTFARFEASGFRISVEGVDRGEHKILSSNATPDLTIIVRAKGAPGRPKTITIQGPPAGQYELECHDVINSTKLTIATPQTCAVESEYALIYARRTGKPEERNVVSSVQVEGKADLKVEELIARWQAYRESQRQIMASYIADALTAIHFEPINTGGSGFDVQMRFKQFAPKAGQVEWLQTEFYVNGVKFKKVREFPLPQLEPEKVMTPPLELKLDEKYGYRMAGTDTVDGVLCYVIGVEPKTQSKELLYSGKIWIDGTTYRQVKMELRQRGATGNVISNVETQSYSLVPDGKGHQLNLVKHIYAQQILNAAGRNFTLQKTYDFSGHVIDPAGFDADLKAARAGDDPMFRDTDTGLKALRKDSSGQRVVLENNQKRIRTIIAGALYEGTFNFPIPLLGLSWVDFNFKNTGTQLSVFFAGPILAANLSKQYGSKFRLGLDILGNGIPVNNRIYFGNVEQKQQTLYQWSEGTGLRATWQPTTSLGITASTHVVYDLFRGNSDTDKNYVLPRNGVTFYPGLEFKYARKGYITTLSGSQGIRAGWKEFGYTAGAKEPFYDKFTTYSAEFAKTYYLGSFTKAGWEFDYYGGDRLDRFSRYRPSFFSKPRIRGIPNGNDAFDAIVVGSANFGFNVLEFIKLEGYYNYARARNKFESRKFELYDGFQTDFGTAGPWGTYLQGTVTYALRGNLPRYNSRFGVYFMIFKPLKN